MPEERIKEEFRKCPIKGSEEGVRVPIGWKKISECDKNNR